MLRSYQKLFTPVQPCLHIELPVTNMIQNRGNGLWCWARFCPRSAVAQTGYKVDDPSGRIPRTEHMQLDITVSIREFLQSGQDAQE